MNGFTKIDPQQLPGNAIELFDKGWALLTAGSPDDYNTMTISWGQLGCLWNLPVCTVFVRPCRHTYKYMQSNSGFTVCLFDKEDCRPQLTTLGTKSGRDMDKMCQSGLTPFEHEGQMAFAEARAILVLDKLYDHQFDAAKIPQAVHERSYKTVSDDDLHRLYIGQIKEAYIRK